MTARHRAKRRNSVACMHVGCLLMGARQREEIDISAASTAFRCRQELQSILLGGQFGEDFGPV